MRPVCCPDTSIRNSHYSLSNNAEGHTSQGVVCLRGYVTTFELHRHFPFCYPESAGPTQMIIWRKNLSSCFRYISDSETSSVSSSCSGLLSFYRHLTIPFALNATTLRGICTRMVIWLREIQHKLIDGYSSHCFHEFSHKLLYAICDLEHAVHWRNIGLWGMTWLTMLKACATNGASERWRSCPAQKQTKAQSRCRWLPKAD